MCPEAGLGREVVREAQRPRSALQHQGRNNEVAAMGEARERPALGIGAVLAFNRRREFLGDEVQVARGAGQQKVRAALGCAADAYQDGLGASPLHHLLEGFKSRDCRTPGSTCAVGCVAFSGVDDGQHGSARGVRLGQENLDGVGKAV